MRWSVTLAAVLMMSSTATGRVVWSDPTTHASLAVATNHYEMGGRTIRPRSWLTVRDHGCIALGVGLYLPEGYCLQVSHGSLLIRFTNGKREVTVQDNGIRVCEGRRSNHSNTWKDTYYDLDGIVVTRNDDVPHRGSHTKRIMLMVFIPDVHEVTPSRGLPDWRVTKIIPIEGWEVIKCDESSPSPSWR